MLTSIRSRIAFAAVILVVLVGALAFLATDRAYRHILDTVAAGTVVDGQRAFEALRTTRAENINIAIDVLAGDTEIEAAFARRDRARLLRLTLPRFETLKDAYGISRMYFYELDEGGTIFLRTYLGGEALDPSAYGDPSGSSVLRVARRSGEAESGFELGRSALSLRVISPLKNRVGETIGYLGLAQQVHEYMAAVSARTGDQYALFISKGQLEREAWAKVQRERGRPDTWDQYASVVLADSTLEDAASLASFTPGRLSNEAQHLGFVTRGDAVYSAGVFPINASDGQPVGQVFVQRDLTQLATTLRRAQLGLVVAFLVLAVIAAASSIAIVERMVFHRLDGMFARLERMSLSAAGGEWEGPPADHVPPRDEFGRFEKYFAGLMAVISAAARQRAGDDSES